MVRDKQTQLSSLFLGEPYMYDTEKILSERIKPLLDIHDGVQDDLLKIIIGNVEKHLFLKLRKINKSIMGVPSELSFVVEEIAIKRYNRIGSEGFKTDSVEGHAITFYDLDDYFKPYDSIIDDYADIDESDGKGKVIMI